jgi:DNA-binding NtrC family response regulator
MERNNLVDFQIPASTPTRRVEAKLSGGRISDVLVVDPSHELQLIVRDLVGSVAIVNGCSTFEEARRRLLASPPDLLVTTVRLNGHNGIHLVYIASRYHPGTRCMVHLTAKDFAMARDAEAAGAIVVRDFTLESAIESLVFGSAVALRSQTRAEN